MNKSSIMSSLKHSTKLFQYEIFYIEIEGFGSAERAAIIFCQDGGVMHE
jgi:hypothetical protein